MVPTRCAVLLAASLLLTTTTWAQQTQITGRVLDERGQPLAGVDLDFVLSATGDDISTNNDVTDLNGNFAVLVDPGIYDVRFSPVPGQPLAGHLEPEVNLNTDQNVGDVVLRDAWFVNGKVLRSDTGLAAVGVDLDFEDLATGLKVFTPLDNSDLTGTYRVAVPPGIYRVTFDGPEPELPSDPPQLAHGFLEEVSVDGSGEVDLPTVVLPLGYRVEGELLDSIGIPVAGADLDFFLAGTEEQIFTKRDNTDASGAFETIVPAGVYDIEMGPAPGSTVLTVVETAVAVAADTILGTRFLPQGPAVAGAVRDGDGRPLRDVDLDLFSSSSGAAVATTNDDTDAAGQYGVRVAPGTYDIRYSPRVHRHVEPQTSFAVSVASDTTLPDVVLPYHDEDGDGTADIFDNCALQPNATQLDTDLDAVGDLCDNCPALANDRQEDNDGDGTGDACDPDDDGDGIADASDPDVDGDGVANAVDNCAQAANPAQLDRDADGQGDACDADDGEVERIEARTASGFVWRREAGIQEYQVYRQRREWLSGINYGTCFHRAAEGTVLVDPEIPPPGGVWTYLVTSRSAGGAGSLGRDAAGDERPNLRACP